MLFKKVLKYEGDNDTFIWKYPAEDFNTGSQLIVHESQEAVFLQNGRALDIFGPGRFTLETENLPVITELMNIATGGRNSFHCELYFINKTEQMAIPWGTDSKIQYMDPVYNFPIELGAHGELSLQVDNAGKALVKLVGTEKQLLQSQFAEKMRVFVMKHIKSLLPQLIKEQQISVFDLDSHIAEFSDVIKQPLQEEYEDYGFALKKFVIRAIQKPDENPDYIRFKRLHYQKVNNVAEAQIRQQVEVINAQTSAQKKVIDAEATAKKRELEGYTYQQEKAFQVADDVAKNEAVGEVGNIGIGLGMIGGIAGGVGSTMGNVFASATQAAGNVDMSQPKPEAAGYCPHCGTPYKSGALFCEKCGNRLEKKHCPNCGEELSETAVFCPKCGTKVGE